MKEEYKKECKCDDWMMTFSFEKVVTQETRTLPPMAFDNEEDAIKIVKELNSKKHNLEEEQYFSTINYPIYICQGCGKKIDEPLVRKGKWHDDDINTLLLLVGDLLEETGVAEYVMDRKIQAEEIE